MIFKVVRGWNGKKMVQNDKKLCLSCSISQESNIWSSFVVYKCKMMSRWGFFYFFKNLIFQVNKLKFFPEHVCLKLWLYLIWLTLSKAYILLRDNPCFHKTNAICYICKFIVREHEICYKSTHNLIFFNIWCFL